MSENRYMGGFLSMLSSVFQLKIPQFFLKAVEGCGQKTKFFSTFIEFYQIQLWRSFEPSDHESGHGNLFQCMVVGLHNDFPENLNVVVWP